MSQIDLLALFPEGLPSIVAGFPEEAEQGKAEGAYKTISEVSEELDVPTHVLRFWESRFPQVKPQRMRGGRRYYRPGDVQLLKRIKTLLYSQGYTIKGAKQHVKGGKLSQEGAMEAAIAQPVAQALPLPQPPARAKRDRSEVASAILELREIKQTLDALL